MAKREVLGTVACPECEHDGAEVKQQKNGLPYRYCPDCDAQYFPRTTVAGRRLWAKIGRTDGGLPVSVTDPAPEPEAAKPAAPVPKPKPVATGNPLLDWARGAT